MSEGREDLAVLFGGLGEPSPWLDSLLEKHSVAELAQMLRDPAAALCGDHPEELRVTLATRVKAEDLPDGVKPGVEWSDAEVDEVLSSDDPQLWLSSAAR